MGGKSKRKESSKSRARSKPAKAVPRSTRASSRKAGTAKRSLRVVKGQSEQIELPLNAKEPRKQTSLKLVSTEAKTTETSKPAGRTSNSPRVSAETLATKQREISVSEFFTRNRHLLGFDNPQKALLTTIKEAVDNSLDACEEAGILPDLEVIIETLAEDRFRIAVQDNGPGIVRAQIPKIFAKLLYGSKFHTLKQSRGQQGIGISAASMYGQLTTGKPVRIWSRTDKKNPAHYYEMHIDTRHNAPEVVKDEKLSNWHLDHGTRVEIELAAIYKRGRRSVDDYIEQTAIANPHATIRYRPPTGETTVYERATEEPPRETVAIKPHPHGVELGILIKMLKETDARSLKVALMGDFSRVSSKIADEIVAKAGLQPDARPKDLSRTHVEQIFRAIPNVKIMAPPTNCLAPIGEEAIISGLKKRIEADFYDASTRSPNVYRGNPFQVEVGVAYGGSLPAEELAEVFRVANRVPLQYQAAACAITKAVMGTDWRNYGLQQSRGALPTGPLVLFVHIASVWVPFTSESKEAIAHYPEILRELRLGLQEVGRKLGAHIRRRKREAAETKKLAYIQKYIPQIGIALQDILALTDRQRDKTVNVLTDTLERSRKV
ncbi:MAG: DNA topoisomerase VI subunit B [Vicinamibacteria bacterium]